MKIIPIFAEQTKFGIWSVCFPEDSVGGEDRDVYSILMDEKWVDTSYLLDFFTKNEDHLKHPFWGGISIDEAVDKVYDEINFLDSELYEIETNAQNSKRKLSDIFKKLHDNVYSINFDKEDYRKAKPNVSKPIIRIYGIELEDGTIIITGGVLKVTAKIDDTDLEKETKRLKRVQSYLKENGITDIQGLI